MLYEVYLITNNVNGKRYVGQTKQGYHNRFLQHCEESIWKPKYTFHLHNAIRKYGVQSFSVKCLLKNIPEDKIDFYESLWIKKLHTHYSEGGYNQTYGGGGIKGYKHSLQTRQKISELVNRKKDIIFTPQRANKISISLTGKKKSFIHRKHLSESIKRTYINGRIGTFLGKHHTEETKKIISEKRKTPVYMYTLDRKHLLREFDCIKSASKWVVDNGLTRNKDAASRICGVCLGKKYYNSAYGYYWTHNKEV